MKNGHTDVDRKAGVGCCAHSGRAAPTTPRLVWLFLTAPEEGLASLGRRR